MKKPPYQNNITHLRTSLIKGSGACAKEIGVSDATWSRIEAGLIQYEPHLKDIARALRCKPSDITDPDLRKRTVRITKWIKNKSYVYAGPVLKNDQVLAPPGLPKTTEACVVKNPDHPSYPKNTLLFFDSHPTTSPSKFLERECIVKISKSTRGDLLLAWVTRGSKENTYILHQRGQKMEIDVKLIFAHPILASVMP